MASRRPQTRGECRDQPGACPFVSCRYNLAVDVTSTGSLWVQGQGTFAERQRAGDEELEAFADAVVRYIEAGGPTCALDIAEQGGVSVQRIGPLFGVTRQMGNNYVQNATRRLRVQRVLQRLMEEYRSIDAVRVSDPSGGYLGASEADRVKQKLDKTRIRRQQLRRRSNVTHDATNALGGAVPRLG